MAAHQVATDGLIDLVFWLLGFAEAVCRGARGRISVGGYSARSPDQSSRSQSETGHQPWASVSAVPAGRYLGEALVGAKRAAHRLSVPALHPTATATPLAFSESLQAAQHDLLPAQAAFSRAQCQASGALELLAAKLGVAACSLLLSLQQADPRDAASAASEALRGLCEVVSAATQMADEAESGAGGMVLSLCPEGQAGGGCQAALLGCLAYALACLRGCCRTHPEAARREALHVFEHVASLPVAHGPGVEESGAESAGAQFRGAIEQAASTLERGLYPAGSDPSSAHEPSGPEHLGSLSVVYLAAGLEASYQLLADALTVRGSQPPCPAGPSRRTPAAPCATPDATADLRRLSGESLRSYEAPRAGEGGGAEEHECETGGGCMEGDEHGARERRISTSGPAPPQSRASATSLSETIERLLVRRRDTLTAVTERHDGMHGGGDGGAADSSRPSAGALGSAPRNAAGKARRASMVEGSLWTASAPPRPSAYPTLATAAAFSANGTPPGSPTSAQQAQTAPGSPARPTSSFYRPPAPPPWAAAGGNTAARPVGSESGSRRASSGSGYSFVAGERSACAAAVSAAAALSASFSRGGGGGLAEGTGNAGGGGAAVLPPRPSAAAAAWHGRHRSVDAYSVGSDGGDSGPCLIDDDAAPYDDAAPLAPMSADSIGSEGRASSWMGPLRIQITGPRSSTTSPHRLRPPAVPSPHSNTTAAAAPPVKGARAGPRRSEASATSNRSGDTFGMGIAAQLDTPFLRAPQAPPLPQPTPSPSASASSSFRREGSSPRESIVVPSTSVVLATPPPYGGGGSSSSAGGSRGYSQSMSRSMGSGAGMATGAGAGGGQGTGLAGCSSRSLGGPPSGGSSISGGLSRLSIASSASLSAAGAGNGSRLFGGAGAVGGGGRGAKETAAAVYMSALGLPGGSGSGAGRSSAPRSAA